ncbi:MAG: hypothetical protein MK554_15620, partial [Planctomycetes bacterium]|nr:hypothetical protein [Planctomycetota bacterium]
VQEGEGPGPDPDPEPGDNFVRGDANSDGAINLTDGVIPLLFLFSGGAAPACMDAADTNDTGAVEITDAIIIFSWLFTGGVAPAVPSPQSPGYYPAACGPYATKDGLGCETLAPTCGLSRPGSSRPPGFVTGPKAELFQTAGGDFPSMR